MVLGKPWSLTTSLKKFWDVGSIIYLVADRDARSEEHTSELQSHVWDIDLRDITSTTSVPPFWMRFVRYSVSSAVKLLRGLTCKNQFWRSFSDLFYNIFLKWGSILYKTCDKRGKIVTPAWPPTPGTSTSLGSTPSISAWKKKTWQDIHQPLFIQFHHIL